MALLGLALSPGASSRGKSNSSQCIEILLSVKGWDLDATQAIAFEKEYLHRIPASAAHKGVNARESPSRSRIGAIRAQSGWSRRVLSGAPQVGRHS